MTDKIMSPTLRGVTSSIFQVDDMSFPPEEVVFEVENVKLSLVNAIKLESGFYIGLEKGELYAVDVECEAGKVRFHLGFLRKNTAKRVYDDALNELFKLNAEFRAELFEESPEQKHLSTEARTRLVEYLYGTGKELQQRG